MTIDSLVHPLRGHAWSSPSLFIGIRQQWSRDPALWRSIAAGLGMAALGLAMAGFTFGLLAP